MRKIISLLLVFAMVLSLVACKAGGRPDNSTTEGTTGHTVPSGTVSGGESTEPSASESTEPSEPIPSEIPTQPSEPAVCEHELEVVTIQISTCTEPGRTTSLCTKCLEEFATEIPAAGHNFTDATCAKAKTCTVCGVTEGEALGHSYTGGECGRCGAKMPGYQDKPTGCEHNYRVTSQNAPTCTSAGSFTYTCSKCGEFYTETIEAGGHKYADATCTKPQTCIVCSATTGKALGHKYSNYRCTRCGAADPNKPTAFTLTVRSDKGNVMADITVTVYPGNSTIPAGTAKTDSNGRATIDMEESSSYRVVLSDIPVGFEADESYSFSSMLTNVTLKSVPVLDPLDHSRAEYKVGSTMADFTVTDTDGITYNLYDLLEEKKLVILNFWYVTCVPCKSEFPYFETGYKEYADDVQLLTMNHFDSEEKIKELRSEMGVTFPMIAENLGMMQGFGLTAYPTTVFIDSNGKILEIHKVPYKTEAEFFKVIEKYLKG